MKKTLLFLGIIVIALAFYFYSSSPQEVTISPSVQEITGLSDYKNSQEKEDLVQPDQADSLDGPIDQPVESDAPSEDDSAKQDAEEVAQTIKIEPRTKINAPFIVQAPFADWSERYQETCEEASVLIAHNFYQGVTELSQDEMKAQIDTLTDWGDQRFAGRLDTNLQETSLYLTEYFKYDSERIKIIKDPTIDDLKAILDKGYPIIVPVAGRELGNKYYTQPGPIYHMLVLTGYDRDEFVTNDPGTKRGEGYRYKQEVLYNAIHDWTGDYETILQGDKIILVVTS